MSPEHCSRCGREAPPDPLSKDWEHNLDVDNVLTAEAIAWVCPGCLTGVEQDAIQREIEGIDLDERAGDD